MGNKRIKLLYITTSSTGGGGVARILSQKTDAFVQMGFQVQIISTNDTQKQPFYSFHPQIQWQFYTAPIRTISQVKRYYSFVQQQGIEVFNPDVIFVLDNGIKGYFASYFLKTEIPIYFEVHGSRNFLLSPILSKWKRHLVNHLTRWLSKRFTGLIVLNESSKKDWAHANIKVIPNWIALNQNIQPTNKLSKQAIAIGRLVPEKNYETLLAIWKQVAVVHPDWYLVICGTGTPSYVAQLQSIAVDSVIWKGEVEDVNREIQASAFMLHTSNMEGMPMAFLEAMAHEVPVVAFDVDYGPSDLIDDGVNGYLIPPANPQQMVERCLSLMTQPELCKQLGAQARKDMQEYDKSKVLQQWIYFFESLP
ncbi:glycosyltransferase [Myroides fluvii]|uniref:glycosyltransferase n=1 Tax=Myroides fluvii TaxID=2572594 RepID=UPI00131AB252|nr:glycosyltransferase [Myroides fluvii]